MNNSDTVNIRRVGASDSSPDNEMEAERKRQLPSAVADRGTISLNPDGRRPFDMLS